jgi:phage tail-like protein
MSLMDPTPNSQYDLYEIVDRSRKIGGFDSLTGGDQVISMVKYKVIDPLGNVISKYMPGQTTFDAFNLLRPIDIVALDIYKSFQDSVSGKLKTLRKNYSISMNDAKGNPLIWWHLNNALPQKITGLAFNEYVEAKYATFELSLVPEEVKVVFEEWATVAAVAEANKYWADVNSGSTAETNDTGETTS